MKKNEMGALSQMEEEVESILNQLSIPLSPEARQLLKSTILNMEQAKTLPAQALGCTPEMMEVIYNHGYQLFYAGKYDKALPIFSTLRTLDPKDARYPFAIAACYHRNKEYLDAATNYILSHSLNLSEPYSCFYLYDCFMKAGYPLSALAAIQEAFTLADSDPKYQDLKPKIELEYQHLQEFLKTYFNKNKT